ncbi:MAG: diguanylate cyclase [Synergistales bacterium]|nr:diguanylate cyclase [Synergistales bacterium]
MESRPILIIDDNDDDFRILARYAGPEYRALYDDGSSDVGALTERHRPDCIMIDYHLAGKKGIEVLRRLKADAATAHIPVVMITGETDPSVIIEGMKSGAADYLVKERLRKTAVKATVRQAIEKAEMERKLEEQRQQIVEFSRTDELTGVFNRRYMLERLRNEIDRTKRSGTTFTLTMLDVDHLKEINDTCGHLAGDRLLVEVVEVIRKGVRKTDYLGRYGGDEFLVVLLESVRRSRWETLKLHAAKIDTLRRAIASRRIPWDGGGLSVSASFGVAIYGEHTPSCTALLDEADRMLYRAKQNGKNSVACSCDGQGGLFTGAVD